MQKLEIIYTKNKINMNISIVVPVYNSSSIIENLTNDILSTTKEISDVNKIQLILVNDCSTDESWKKISKLSSEYKEMVIGINLMKTMVNIMQ